MNGLLNFLKIFSAKKKQSEWVLEYTKLKPSEVGLQEALCTLGNGYIATRGAITESRASRVNYPGTYMAGVYNKLGTEMSGKMIFNEDLVNCPNWLPLFIKTDDKWINPYKEKILFYKKQLDMKNGTLSRKMYIMHDNGKKTMIETYRIVSMDDPHLCAIRYSIVPQNYSGKIWIRSGLDSNFLNAGVQRYRKLNSKHLKGIRTGNFGKNIIYLSCKTTASNIEIAMAARTRVFSGSRRVISLFPIIDSHKSYITADFCIKVQKGKRYDVEKIVTVYKNTDLKIKRPVDTAIKMLRKKPDFKDVLKAHKKAWHIVWKKFYFLIDGEEFSKLALRLHAFHLIQTASIHNVNIDAGMPARGLHGEAYRGHVFWDEMYIQNFYELSEPAIAKSLLMYRYRRLNKAKEYAQANGFKGAMFPWQSGSEGVEETQIIHLNPMSGKWDPDHSCIQRHISFAISYNIWKYYERTSDKDFLSRYGLEMLLTIAQFGVSLCKLNKKDGRYHTDGLMGPDEFHEKLPRSNHSGFKDNAYTNLMIVWTIMKALKGLDIVTKAQKRAMFKKLGITISDIDLWNDIIHKMNIVINHQGIISQFDGYFKLKELNWDFYRSKYGNIQRMDRILKAEGKSPDDYKVSKQADALMIFYVLSIDEIKSIFKKLGYKFDRNILKKNYDYYVKRTSHGSTLSKVVHCYIAHILGRTKEAWKWYNEVLISDIHDTQGGTTSEGIHAGVMAGSLNIMRRAFAGIAVLDNKITIDPALPKIWNSINLKLKYKESWISIHIKREEVDIRVRSTKNKKVTIAIDILGKAYYFVSGHTNKILLNRKVNALV